MKRTIGLVALSVAAPVAHAGGAGGCGSSATGADATNPVGAL